ncbi:MAG: MarR family winged helix-turn-helix transcriptional regulator [Paracoccaceae bacterium]
MGTERESVGSLFPFVTPDELDRYLPYLLTRISHIWNSQQADVLAEAGISKAEMRVLSCLSAYGELTVGEISTLSVIEQSSASRTVDQLVMSGMVERHIGQDDQRKRTVVLTNKGAERLSAMAPFINQQFSAFVEGIDADSLNTAVRVLCAILDRHGDR